MKALHIYAIAGLFLVATASWASDSKPSLSANDYAGFQAQSQVIRRDLNEGMLYSELDQK
jgi:hypothetical protein